MKNENQKKFVGTLLEHLCQDLTNEKEEYFLKTIINKFSNTKNASVNNFQDLYHGIVHNKSKINFNSLNYFFDVLLEKNPNITNTIGYFGSKEIFELLLNQCDGDYSKIIVWTNRDKYNSSSLNSTLLNHSIDTHLKNTLTKNKDLDLTTGFNKNLAIINELMKKNCITQEHGFSKLLSFLIDHKHFHKSNYYSYSSKDPYHYFPKEGVEAFLQLLTNFKNPNLTILKSLSDPIKTGFLSGRYAQDRGFKEFPAKPPLLDYFLKNNSDIMFNLEVFNNLLRNFYSKEHATLDNNLFFEQFNDYFAKNSSLISTLDKDKIRSFSSYDFPLKSINMISDKNNNIINIILDKLTLNKNFYDLPNSHLPFDIIENLLKHSNKFLSNQESIIFLDKIVSNIKSGAENKNMQEGLIEKIIPYALSNFGLDFDNLKNKEPYKTFFEHPKFYKILNEKISVLLNSKKYLKEGKLEDYEEKGINYFIKNNFALSPSFTQNLLNDEGIKPLRNEWIEYYKENIYTELSKFNSTIRNIVKFSNNEDFNNFLSLCEKVSFPFYKKLREAALSVFSGKDLLDFYGDAYKVVFNNIKKTDTSFSIDESLEFLKIINTQSIKKNYQKFMQEITFINTIFPLLSFSKNEKYDLSKAFYPALKTFTEISNHEKNPSKKEENEKDIYDFIVNVLKNNISLKKYNPDSIDNLKYLLLKSKNPSDSSYIEAFIMENTEVNKKLPLKKSNIL